MDVVGFVVVVVALLSFAIWKSRKDRRVRQIANGELVFQVGKKKKGIGVYQANRQMLVDRWRQIEALGESADVPRWYWDAITERQYERLLEEGLDVQEQGLTKGQASDVIGLFCDLSDEESEILKFFKIPVKGLNQTIGRGMIDDIFSRKENVERWEGRPANAWQKFAMKYLSVKAPKNITFSTAEKMISDYVAQIADEESELANEKLLEKWENIEMVWGELEDKETRDCLEIKKISVSLFAKAIEMCEERGDNLAEIDDCEVAEMAMEINPAIRRGE